MNVHFRSRINSFVNYSAMMNTGICCNGNSTIASPNYIDCFLRGGFYIPKIANETLACPQYSVNMTNSIGSSFVFTSSFLPIVFYTNADGDLKYITSDITDVRAPGASSGPNLTIPETTPGIPYKFKSVGVGYKGAVGLTIDGTRIVGWGNAALAAGAIAITNQIAAENPPVTIEKISMGAYTCLVLLSDGRVVSWGSHQESQQLSDHNKRWTGNGYTELSMTNVYDRVFEYIPAESSRLEVLSDVVYITSFPSSDPLTWTCAMCIDPTSESLSCEISPTDIPIANKQFAYKLYRSGNVNCGRHPTFDSPYIVGDETYPPPSSQPNGAEWSGIVDWSTVSGAPNDYQFSRSSMGDPSNVNYTGTTWIPAFDPKSAMGVATRNGEPVKYVDISSGEGHNLLLTDDGRIETWGSNWYYTITGSGLEHEGWKRIGAGIDPITSGNDNHAQIKSMKNVQNSVKAIGTGHNSSLSILPDGSIFCWDRNDFGQSTGTVPAGSFTQVSGGKYHALALDTNGNVHAWGDNSYNKSTVPTITEPCILVFAGNEVSCAVTGTGKIISWGNISSIMPVVLPVGASIDTQGSLIWDTQLVDNVMNQI